MGWFDAWMLAALALLAFLAAGALAPLETLGWWAGWFGDDEPKPPEPRRASARKSYLVFLSGIHSVSGRTFARREQALLQELRRRLPDTCLVEVFPYSVTNRALTGQRVFSRFWRWALAMKVSRRNLSRLAGLVINFRNLWQVAVSADRRYGPLYNLGSAQLIAAALAAEGYAPGSGTPVALLGYSGGAQIAIGAAAPLGAALGGSVSVIAVGGVMSSDPGLERVSVLHHLHGDRDLVQRLSYLFFPGRWPLLPYSAWNQARAAGRIRPRRLGPMGHTGRFGYLDADALLADGRSYLEATADAICDVLSEAGGERYEVPAPLEAPAARG